MNIYLSKSNVFYLDIDNKFFQILPSAYRLNTSKLKLTCFTRAVIPGVTQRMTKLNSSYLLKKIIGNYEVDVKYIGKYPDGSAASLIYSQDISYGRYE